ncbi:MAG: tRNA (adenosine(37)-N6)-dimethylallyltransferase MiaA [Candidatus Puniceispirillales bacterium]
MEQKTPLPIVVIAGPTASGKSAFALALAEAANGVVINADSMQVYSDLPVLTAIPDADDRARAPHEGYAVLDGAERCSVAGWLDITRAAVQRAREAGRLPILTGGTGMYIRAALEGISPIPDVDPAIRAAVIARHENIGGAAFRAELGQVDPLLADRLADGDSQRLIRGMEVYRATGQPLSQWQEAAPEGALIGARQVLLIAPPRDELYRRINARFPLMLETGAVEEARTFLARRLDATLPLMKGVGLSAVEGLISGKFSREETVEMATRDTRRFAKRQLTWFRHQLTPDAVWDGQKFEQYLKRFFEENLSKIIN